MLAELSTHLPTTFSNAHGSCLKWFCNLPLAVLTVRYASLDLDVSIETHTVNAYMHKNTPINMHAQTPTYREAKRDRINGQREIEIDR